MPKLSRVIIGGDEVQSKHRDDWYQEFVGCLQDLGGSAYDESRVLRLYGLGYSPADAAGEEVCEDEE